MNHGKVKALLEAVRRGEISVEAALRELKLLHIAQVEDFLRFDVGRELRRLIPEVILALGKTPGQTFQAARRAASETGHALVTKASKQHLSRLKRLGKEFNVKVWEEAGLAVVRRRGWQPPETGGRVAVFTAGTADIPVALEAEAVAVEMGCQVYRAYDVGVAGLHRLIQPLREAVEWGADVYVVAAGMEGALPSVIASLVDAPVVGVPTSVGYGYGSGGRAALMAMLQSCSLGLAVVNVDNGVGAGAYAALIASRAGLARKARHPGSSVG